MSVDHFKIEFLKKTLTTPEQRDKAELDWGVLHSIAQHHAANRQELENRASFEANNLRLIDGISSVSWRIKSEFSLIEKIIRKRAEPNTKAKPNKYRKISAENYQEIITDLIGIRGLHLFRSDFRIIHTAILRKCTLAERPIMYVRAGDSTLEENQSPIRELKIGIKVHPKGYRSLHYIIQSGAKGKGGLPVEYQIRTLYDEAWSEIDHKISYPNLINNQTVAALLKMLNRISGSADELATVIQVFAEAARSTPPRLTPPGEGDLPPSQPIVPLPPHAGGGLLDPGIFDGPSSPHTGMANLGLGFPLGYTDLIGNQAREILGDRKNIDSELQKIKELQAIYGKTSELQSLEAKLKTLKAQSFPPQGMVDYLKTARQELEMRLHGLGGIAAPKH